MDFPEKYDDLFKMIKKKLRVSFSEFDEDIKESIIEGIAEIEDKTGELDFLDSKKLSSIKGRKILKLYCQYSWNNTLQYFWEDHRADVISLQIRAAQERREASEQKETY